MKRKRLNAGFLARKTLHIAIIGAFAIAALSWGRWPTLPVAGGVLTLMLLGEWLRTRSPLFRSVLLRTLGPLMTPKERRVDRRVRLNGATWALISVVALLILFPMSVAGAALIVLAVGDPVAALVGSQYGRLRVGKKSLEGTVAFFAASLLAVLALTPIPIAIAAVGCLAAAVVELVPLPGYDNPWIAAAAAIALTAMTWLV